MIWDYDLDKEKQTLSETRSLGLLIHVWTFRDDAVMLDAQNSLVIFSYKLVNV